MVWLVNVIPRASSSHVILLQYGIFLRFLINFTIIQISTGNSFKILYLKSGCVYSNPLDFNPHPQSYKVKDLKMICANNKFCSNKKITD